MNRIMPTIKELYRVGKGPSSSHTIGPERACKLFRSHNPEADCVKVILYGSLARTGKGHGTDRIIKEVFDKYNTEIEYNYDDTDTGHPNTMDMFAFKNGIEINYWRVFSVGGGQIKIKGISLDDNNPLYRHKTFSDIAQYCTKKKISLWEYVKETEGNTIIDFLNHIWFNMKESINTGLHSEGKLPGGLGVERKAKYLFEQADISKETKENCMVCAYAFAVSEQNASGGTVVTAPTCGSAGVLPAVMLYEQQKHGFDDNDIIKALAVSGLIGNLIKTNASISGAECGCQAEIGSACSMAAAGLGELFSMSIDQIEYAAEIAMEHHLGLTCDPVMGLVQIPCIERNAVAAMRAINAVNLAHFLSKTRKISFDWVIKTMYETGTDMLKKYKETSNGGLAKIYPK